MHRFCILLFSTIVCAQTDWKLESPLPTWRDITDCIWAGDKFIAVGSFGLVMTSADGSLWKKSATATNIHLRSVAWSGSTFVAVGDTGTIISSRDALTWTTINSGSWKNFRRVIWANGHFVLVGDNTDNKPINTPGAVYTSTDGNSWKLRDQGTTAISLTSVIWTGQKFVAVGSGGKILTSTDAVNWTAVSIPYRSKLSTIAFSGNHYIANGNGDTLVSSTDATNWTVSKTGVAGQIRSSCWASGRFISVGESGAIISSTDGSAWIKNLSPTTKALSTVVWNGASYCAAGDTGTVLASSDGQSWSLKSTEPPPKLHSILWGNGQFVALGEAGTVFTSPDGLAWTKVNSGTTVRLNHLTWNGLRYVAVGYNGPIVTSDNGKDWSVQVAPQSPVFYAVAGNASKFIALGRTYDNGGGIWRYIYSSPDGISWSSKISGAQASSVHDFYSMVWTGSSFAAVGDGVLISNSEGNYWNEWSTSSFNYGFPSCIIEKAGIYYVTTSSGEIYCNSFSGYNWARVYSDKKSCLTSICWNGSEFIATGLAGKMVISPDGSIWTSIDLGYGETPGLGRIHQTSDRMVIFGEKGLMLWKPKPVVSTINKNPLVISNRATAGKLMLAKTDGNHLSISVNGRNLLGRRIGNPPAVSP